MEETRPLEGVSFNVYRLTTVDPLVADDWATFTGLDATSLTPGVGMELMDTITTGLDGSATSKAMPVGFYFVTELPSEGLIPISPFLMALPTTSFATVPNGEYTSVIDAWKYDATVYPKNQHIELIKTVSDQDVMQHSAYGLDDNDMVTYRLRGSVPAPMINEDYGVASPFNTYRMVDDYPWETLVLDDDSHRVMILVSADAVEPENVPDGVINDNGVLLYELVRDVHYTVTHDDDDWGRVVMELTSGDSDPSDPAGSSGLFELALARQLDPRVKVEWSFDAEMFGKGEDTGGKVSNTASLYPPHPAGVAPTMVTSNTVVTDMISIQVKKFDGETSAPLDGASFDLRRCELGTNDLLDDTVLDNSHFYGEQGAVTFRAVQSPSFANNAPRDALWDYCVVETAAPEGYQLLPEPVQVDMSAVDASNVVVVDVANWRIDGQPLPATGGLGLWLAIGGMVIVLVGGVAIVIRRKNASLDDVIAS